MVTISNKEKWKDVDRIIETIELRRKNGLEGTRYPLEEYVDYTFNNNRTEKKG